MAILREALFAPHIAAVGAAAAAPAEPDAGATLGDADRARLTALYGEHGARIQRFLRDLLGDPALAADATQETFTRAYKQLRAFRDGERIAPWLFGIARNVSLEMRKARYRAGRHVLSGHVSEGAASEASPESDYLGREALRVVGEALAALPEERRAMLLLRLDHGLSYDDIALTMGLSLAKVKVEIWRAREVLRAVRAKYEGDAR